MESSFTLCLHTVLLREQVFQALRMLLEREGKIVTREAAAGTVAQTNSVANQHGALESDRYPWQVNRRTRSLAAASHFRNSENFPGRSLQSARGHNEAYRDDAGRTEREHDFFDHQPCLPTVRRTHEGLRMLRQVRQELAPGMGVGGQRYEEAWYCQSKRCRAKAVSHCLAAL